MKKKWIIVLVALLFFAVFTGCAQDGQELDENVETAAGEIATVAFEGETVSGEAISSALFADSELTMVNIWATWCGPCVEEMPDLEELYGELPDGVNLIGICIDGVSEQETALSIIEETGVTYPIVADNPELWEGLLSKVQAYPTTLFVDSQGNVIGEPVMGAPASNVVASYLYLIDERLAMLP